MIFFFCIIQKMCCIFSVSWEILIKNVNSLSLKLISTIIWESRIESVKSLNFQLKQLNKYIMVCKNYSDSTKDPKLKSEAIFLA